MASADPGEPSVSKDAGASPYNAQRLHEYAEDFRRAAHQAVDWIADYLEHARGYAVLPQSKPGELIDALPQSAPDKGESYDVLLRDFERQILPAVTHWNHPRFMAYFANTGSAPAILGEMLAAALNTNGIHWLTSPAVTELEQVTLGWLRQWLGLPEEFFGVIYDTASVSTMHAIAAARELSDPEARVHGSRSNLVLYTSEQAHSSVEKGAIAIGVGQDNVRKVPGQRRVSHASGSLARYGGGRLRCRLTSLLRGRHRRHHLFHQRGPGRRHRRYGAEI